MWSDDADHSRLIEAFVLSHLAGLQRQVAEQWGHCGCQGPAAGRAGIHSPRYPHPAHHPDAGAVHPLIHTLQHQPLPMQPPLRLLRVPEKQTLTVGEQKSSIGFCLMNQTTDRQTYSESAASDILGFCSVLITACS